MIKYKFISRILVVCTVLFLSSVSDLPVYAADNSQENKTEIDYSAMDFSKYTDENIVEIKHNGRNFVFTLHDFCDVENVEDKFFEITGNQRLSETDEDYSVLKYGDPAGTPYTVHYNDVEGNFHEVTLYIADDKFGINSANSGFGYFIGNPENFIDVPSTHYVTNVCMYNESVYHSSQIVGGSEKWTEYNKNPSIPLQFEGGYPLNFDKEAFLNGDGTLNSAIFDSEAYLNSGCYTDNGVCYGHLSYDVRGEYAHDWYAIIEYKEKPAQVRISENENVSIAFPSVPSSNSIGTFGTFEFAVKPDDGYVVNELIITAHCNGEELNTATAKIVDVTHSNPVYVSYTDSFKHPVTGASYNRTEKINLCYNGWQIFRASLNEELLNEQNLILMLTATVSLESEAISTPEAILEQETVYKEITDSEELQENFSVNKRHYEYIPNTSAKDFVKVETFSAGTEVKVEQGNITVVAVDGHGNPILMGLGAMPTDSNPNLGYRFVNIETDLPIWEVEWNEFNEELSYTVATPPKGSYSIYFYYEPKDFEITVDEKLVDYVTVQPYADAGEQVPIRVSEDCPYDIDALFKDGSSTQLELIEDVFVYDQDIEDEETGKRITDRYTQAFIMYDESITLTAIKELEAPEEPPVVVKPNIPDNPQPIESDVEIGEGETPKTGALPIVLGTTLASAGAGAGYFFLIFFKKKVKIRGVWSEEKIPGMLVFGKKSEDMKSWFVPEIVADTDSKVELVSRLLDCKAYTLFPSDTKISIVTATDSVTVTSEEEMLKILAEIEGPAVVGFESEKKKTKFSIELTK